MTRRWAGFAAALGLLLVAAPANAAGTAPQRTWNFDQVRVPAARAAGNDGVGVVVAVLDSWVDASHRDFEGRVLPGADCVGGTCKNGPATPDRCDHGTHVAGTIASSSFGVAPKARILPVRVLTYDPKTTNCVGQPDDVAAGIRWAVAHGARILNLSLGPDVSGMTTSTAIPSAVSEAASAGAVVIFSAGNSSAPEANTYGAAAMVVAATGRSGQLASYSQRGPGVDVAAPGGDPRSKDQCTQADCVTSLYPGNRYAVAAGTSMAAPHVAGIAALLVGQDPGRTRGDVIARIESTARPLAQAGHGVVDATAALGVPATANPRASAPPRPVQVVRPRASAAASPLTTPQTGIAVSPGLGVVTPVPNPAPLPPLIAGSPLPARLPQTASARSTPDGGVSLPVVLLASLLVVTAGGSVATVGRRTS